MGDYDVYGPGERGPSEQHERALSPQPAAKREKHAGQRPLYSETAGPRQSRGRVSSSSERSEWPSVMARPRLSRRANTPESRRHAIALTAYPTDMSHPDGTAQRTVCQRMEQSNSRMPMIPYECNPGSFRTPAGFRGKPTTLGMNRQYRCYDTTITWYGGVDSLSIDVAGSVRLTTVGFVIVRKLQWCWDLRSVYRMV